LLLAFEAFTSVFVCVWAVARPKKGSGTLKRLQMILSGRHSARERVSLPNIPARAAFSALSSTSSGVAFQDVSNKANDQEASALAGKMKSRRF
jgi:hypothetical protein